MKKEILLLFIMISMISLIQANKESCNSIYYFILENNWNYTNEDLSNNNITQDEISRYPSKCSSEGISPILPKKMVGNLLVNESEEECNVEKELIPDFYIPIIISLGLDKDKTPCWMVNFGGLFFNIEEEGNYVVNGLNVFPMLILIISSMIFLIIKKMRTNINLVSELKTGKLSNRKS
jgi:hypothetical protein